MESLMYISTHHRVQLVFAYAKLQGIITGSDALEDKEFSKLESFIFEDPVNRRLIDKGINKANEEVDLERYQQYSPEWYSDVVRYLPSYYSRTAESAKVDPTVEVYLNEDQLTYLATIIFLAVRGNEIKQLDVETASNAAKSIYKRLVSSK